MRVKGHTGTINFDGVFVTIEPTRFLARASVGNGEKRIPVDQITAVQFKPAGPLVHGFIQFSIGGRNERRSKFVSQTTDAGRDEDSVIFTRRQQHEFEQLRTAVVAAMAAPAGAAGQRAAVDRLRQLAELRDAGVVSMQEFDAAKARLLGGIAS